MNPPSAGVSPLTAVPALVVEPEETDRAFLVSTLTAAGFIVTAVESFSHARNCLLARPPSVLVSEIRLGSHNGLDLALLGRCMMKDMTLVLASRHRDRRLDRDAKAVGAAFVQKPLTKAALLESLYLAALYGAGPTGAPDASGPEMAAPPHTAGSGAMFDSPARRHRRRRRDIATFLLLEAARKRLS